MSDLIERLRRYENTLNGCLIQAPYLGEAADEIERLDKQLQEMTGNKSQCDETIDRLTVQVDRFSG